MESHSKIFGHPAHTILIVFPLGLLSTAVIFDTLSLVFKKPRMAEQGLAITGAGILGGLAAAPWGTWDWLFIPKETRARAVGRVHGLGNAAVLGLFAASWALRRPNPEKLGALPYLLSLLGFGVAGVTGWLGGEMVDRLGVGVDDGANLDAPNSLTGLPADATPDAA
jgi:uncharacterized membrane protein